MIAVVDWHVWQLEYSILECKESLTKIGEWVFWNISLPWMKICIYVAFLKGTEKSE